jgi:hypothetical protein
MSKDKYVAVILAFCTLMGAKALSIPPETKMISELDWEAGAVSKSCALLNQTLNDGK